MREQLAEAREIVLGLKGPRCPKPYTLHPTPHTLHPAPYTLHPPLSLFPPPWLSLSLSPSLAPFLSLSLQPHFPSRPSCRSFLVRGEAERCGVQGAQAPVSLSFSFFLCFFFSLPPGARIAFAISFSIFLSFSLVLSRSLSFSLSISFLLSLSFSLFSLSLVLFFSPSLFHYPSPSPSPSHTLKPPHPSHPARFSHLVGDCQGFRQMTLSDKA